MVMCDPRMHRCVARTTAIREIPAAKNITSERMVQSYTMRNARFPYTLFFCTCQCVRNYTRDHKRQKTRVAQADVALVENMDDGDTLPDDAVVPVFVFDPPISTSSFVVKFKEVSPLVEFSDATFLGVNKSDRSMRHTSLKRVSVEWSYPEVK